MTFFVDLLAFCVLFFLNPLSVYIVMVRTGDKRIARLYCLIKNEHLRLYYTSHTEYPKWHHVFWCGRCGYESSDEREESKRDLMSDHSGAFGSI